jgi:hypothetical protein
MLGASFSSKKSEGIKLVFMSIVSSLLGITASFVVNGFPLAWVKVLVGFDSPWARTQDHGVATMVQ